MLRPTFFLFIVWSSSVLAGKNIKTIWCINDDVKTQRNLMKRINKEESLCKAEATDNYPFTTTQQETPPKPESINVTYRTYQVTYDGKTVKQIAVYVSWTYKIQYFGKVESYHIELNYFNPPGSPRQYLMSWNESLTSVLESADSNLVEFNFIFCGSPPNNFHIHPRDTYRFQIQACPLYQETDTPQAVSKMVTVPGCENKAISKVELCSCKDGSVRKRGRCHKIKDSKGIIPGRNSSTAATASSLGTLQKDENEKSIHLILLIIGIVLIIVFLAFAVLARRKGKVICMGCANRLKETPREKRQVLLICTSDRGFLEPMNHLINIFTEFPRLEVKSNLRQRNEIGEWGIHEWTKKHVNNSDVVVFFVDKSSKVVTTGEENEDGLLDDIDPQLGLILKATEKIIVSNKTATDHKKFIIADIKTSTRKDLPYFKHYKLPAEFKKFAKMVIGDKCHVSDKNRSIFLHSLAIAQLGGYCKESAKEDYYEESVQITNDLDHTPDTSEDAKAQNLDVVNISGSLTWHESFPSYSYVMVDLNEDTSGGSQRSGARPKQSC